MFVEEKSVGEQQPVKVGTLKFSEAIRIGARIRPQCTGRMFARGRSCALGAAYEAVFGPPPENAWDPSDKAHWTLGPCLSKLSERFGQSVYEVWSKNDHGWTREEIADWLESQGK